MTESKKKKEFSEGWQQAHRWRRRVSPTVARALEEVVLHWYACPAAARAHHGMTPAAASAAAADVDAAAAFLAAYNPEFRARLPPGVARASVSAHNLLRGPDPRGPHEK